MDLYYNSWVLFCICISKVGGRYIQVFISCDNNDFSTISLPSELGIEVTGKNTGWLVVWSSFGELVLPFLCSILFDKYSPAVLPWFIVVIFILSFLVLGCALVSAKDPAPKICGCWRA